MATPKQSRSGGCAPTPCSEWIPASTPPPMETWNVIVKGGDYMISEAIYMREPVPMKSGATKPPGFYLNMGGGNILDAEWVEWWIPMPSLPNAKGMAPGSAVSGSESTNPADR